MRVLFLCLALVILPAFVFPTHCHGSSLSDAMKSSADDDDKPLHGNSDSDSDSDSDSFAGSLIGSFLSGIFSNSEDSDDSSYSPGGHNVVVAGGGGGFLTVPLDASYVIPFHGDITSLSRFSIGLTAGKRRTSFGAYFAGGVPGFREGSLLDRGAKNPSMFEVGFLFNHYLTRSHTFISPYFTASVGLQGWSWDFRNPIIVDSDRVTDDNIVAFNGYAGLGIATKRKERCSVFLEAGVGCTVFGGETREGFDNDVFDDFGYVSVKTGLTFRF